LRRFDPRRSKVQTRSRPGGPPRTGASDPSRRCVNLCRRAGRLRGGATVGAAAQSHSAACSSSRKRRRFSGMLCLFLVPIGIDADNLGWPALEIRQNATINHFIWWEEKECVMPYCITLRSRTDGRATGWYAGRNCRWSTDRQRQIRFDNPDDASAVCQELRSLCPRNANVINIEFAQDALHVGVGTSKSRTSRPGTHPDRSAWSSQKGIWLNPPVILPGVHLSGDPDAQAGLCSLLSCGAPICRADWLGGPKRRTRRRTPISPSLSRRGCPTATAG